MDKKMMLKSTAIIILCAIVIGITATHIQKSNANEIKDIYKKENKTVSTNTMNAYCDIMSDMTYEEFEAIFASKEYEREYYNNYELLKKDESKFEKFKDKAWMITEECIDKVTDTVLVKLPKLVKEKFNIDRHSIHVVVKAIVSALDNSVITTSLIAGFITSKLSVPFFVVKALIDITFNILDKVIKDPSTNNPTNEPTKAPSSEPSMEPTEIPSEEPTQEPNVEQTEEPSVEPTIDGDILLDCPPRIEESKEPDVTVQPAS